MPLKLVILNYFENIVLNPTVSIPYDHIYKTCIKVFRHIGYRRNAVKMTFSKNIKFFIKKQNVFSGFVLKRSYVSIIRG